jgi:hypothetical protein
LSARFPAASELSSALGKATFHDSYAAPLGLKTGDVAAIGSDNRAGNLPAGDQAGLFRSLAKTDDEVVMGVDDQHLDVRIFRAQGNTPRLLPLCGLNGGEDAQSAGPALHDPRRAVPSGDRQGHDAPRQGLSRDRPAEDCARAAG